MKKIFISLLFLIVALAVFLVVGRNWIIKTAIDQGVTAATGFKTTVERVKYDLPSTILIEGLSIKNPSGFKAETFVNIPEIYASLVLGEVLKGQKIHLTEVRVNVQEVNVEKNEKGVSNVELLSSVGGNAKKQEPSKQAPPTAEKKPAMPFQLDKLVLTIRKVSYEDHSGVLAASPVAVPGKKMSMDLNVDNEVFMNITDPKVLVNLILVKVLNGATLGRLLELDPQQLVGDSLTSVTSAGKELAGQSVLLAQKQLGSAQELVTSNAAAQKAGQLVGGTTDVAKNALGTTTDVAKTQVSGLFGKVKSLAGTSASPSPSPAS